MYQSATSSVIDKMSSVIIKSKMESCAAKGWAGGHSPLSSKIGFLISPDKINPTC